jgi:hypothetical protein
MKVDERITLNMKWKLMDEIENIIRGEIENRPNLEDVICSLKNKEDHK